MLGNIAHTPFFLVSVMRYLSINVNAVVNVVRVCTDNVCFREEKQLPIPPLLRVCHDIHALSGVCCSQYCASVDSQCML